LRNAGRRRIPKKAVTQDGIYEARKSCPLALAALVNADNLALQMCREELVVAIQDELRKTVESMQDLLSEKSPA